MTVVCKEAHPAFGVMTVLCNEVHPTFDVMTVVCNEVHHSFDVMTVVCNKVRPTFEGMTVVCNKARPTFDVMTVVCNEVHPAYVVMTVVCNEVHPACVVMTVVGNDSISSHCNVSVANDKFLSIFFGAKDKNGASNQLQRQILSKNEKLRINLISQSMCQPLYSFALFETSESEFLLDYVSPSIFIIPPPNIVFIEISTRLQSHRKLISNETLLGKINNSGTPKIEKMQYGIKK